MADSTGIQKKIVDLDPYGAEVIPDSSGNLHPVWNAGAEPPAEAGLVGVSVPLGTGGRYTAKVPMPVAGKGLSQSESGVVDVKYDTATMELLPDGSLASKSAAGSAVMFGVHGVLLSEELAVLEFSSVEEDCHRTEVLVSPDAYPANTQDALPEGDVVFPAAARWIKADAILTFTAEGHAENSEKYNCVFVVQSLDPVTDGNPAVLETHEFPFRLDTSEHISVIYCPVSVYNGSGNPCRLRTGIRWNRAGEPAREISCTGKITITAV